MESNPAKQQKKQQTVLNLNNNQTFQKRKTQKQNNRKNYALDSKKLNEQLLELQSHQTQGKNNKEENILENSFENQQILQLNKQELQQQQQLELQINQEEQEDEEEEKSQFSSNPIIQDQIRQLVRRCDHIPEKTFNLKLKYIYCASPSVWTVKKIVDYMNQEYDSYYAQQLNIQQNILQVKKPISENQNKKPINNKGLSDLLQKNYNQYDDEDEDDDNEGEFEQDTEEEEDSKEDVNENGNSTGSNTNTGNYDNIFYKPLQKQQQLQKQCLKKKGTEIQEAGTNFFDQEEDMRSDFTGSYSDKKNINQQQFEKDLKQQQKIVPKFKIEELQKILRFGGKKTQYQQGSEILIGDEQCSTGMQTCESLYGAGSDQENDYISRQINDLFDTKC